MLFRSKYTAYDTRTSDAETFFYSLISSEEKKTSSSGSEYCYSYIEQATKTKLITNNGYSYGIYFISYNFDKASKIWPRILYVIPGSPADLAGVKRGDWIVSVDNASSVDPYSVISGNAATWGIYKGTPHLANMQNPAYISYKSVGASVLIDENPILKDTVLVYDNKKVAYLNYLSFQTGPDGFEDKS